MNSLSGVLPAETRQMLSQELHQLVSSSNGALGFGAVIGLLLTLWERLAGHERHDERAQHGLRGEGEPSFLRFNAVALLLTVALLFTGTVAIALIAVLPAVEQFFARGAVEQWLALLVQWPLLILLMLFVLAALDRYAPDREEPRWRWISPGAILATGLWIVASIGFTAIIHSSSFGRTYGSLGGVVVLLTWLYLSAAVVLLGAVVNAQAEPQTCKDTTTGPSLPMGRRGAVVADNVAEGDGASGRAR